MNASQFLANFIRKGTLVALIAAIAGSVSCMTTYDAYGQPVQSVDPATATAGIAAAGLLGYALASDNNHHHYPPPYYHHGGHCRY